ncbi:hypothetical protein Vadar_014119 [Vaccinium darrowii]|uniref:Uncharacterized protein n=1 Tax=Vaccinium darrowii TaxID=229202 RepID=A0ACB7YV37_9ERIC|nr:hypothetical protein Vadar_014119 [Vaccinium darrowii]
MHLKLFRSDLHLLCIGSAKPYGSTIVLFYCIIFIVINVKHLHVSGSKFYYLKNEAVLLVMALINWTISEVTRRGFTPLITPEILRSSVVEKCGFQPRGENKQISSASNCTDYQSQRLGIRYRPEASSTRSPKKGKGNLAPTQFVHTLNAKACAVP